MEGTSRPRTLKKMVPDYPEPNPTWRMTAPKLTAELRECRQKETLSLAFLNQTLGGLEGSLKLSHTLRREVEISQDLE